MNGSRSNNKVRKHTTCFISHTQKQCQLNRNETEEEEEKKKTKCRSNAYTYIQNTVDSVKGVKYFNMKDTKATKMKNK